MPKTTNTRARPPAKLVREIAFRIIESAHGRPVNRAELCDQGRDILAREYGYAYGHSDLDTLYRGNQTKSDAMFGQALTKLRKEKRVELVDPHWKVYRNVHERKDEATWKLAAPTRKSTRTLAEIMADREARAKALEAERDQTWEQAFAAEAS